MKRIHVALAVIGLSLGWASSTCAQMGMNLFQKPAIAKFINPVVGKGAEYETTGTGSGDAKTRTMDMGVVGKESVDGKAGFWMQVISTDAKGQAVVAKALITQDDFQFHKMIMQMQGQPAMEMPSNPSGSREQKMQEAINDWHSVGTETITVPAGTFACEHWKNDKNGSDLWASEKVTPFGMVKQVGKTQTMVLTKVLTDFPDRINGPVTKFDPQQMMQQMQQHQQKP